jgi:hypothetical protein
MHVLMAHTACAKEAEYGREQMDQAGFVSFRNLVTDTLNLRKERDLTQLVFYLSPM